MPCGASCTNTVFPRIGVLAYNLFMGFKRLACPAAWASQAIATVRWKLVQVARRILCHERQMILRLVLESPRHSPVGAASDGSAAPWPWRPDAKAW